MSDVALAAQLIRNVEVADSATALVDAVQALADARLEAAVPTLMTALAYNNPGAAVAAVDGLIGIGEPAVVSLLELLDGHNYTARAWAIRALAGIGDPRGLPILLDAAINDFALSVRRAAARGLGTIRWHLLPPEDVNVAQQQCREVLFSVTQDPEWVVRYSAIVGLQSLAIAAFATQPQLVPQILGHLEACGERDREVVIQARIQMAQQQISKLSEAVHLSGEDYESVDASEEDWQNTLKRLYKRKSDERPVPEGDPRRFRPAAASITPPHGSDSLEEDSSTSTAKKNTETLTRDHPVSDLSAIAPKIIGRGTKIEAKSAALSVSQGSGVIPDAIPVAAASPLLPPVITLSAPFSTGTIEHQLIQGKPETYALETILSRSVHAIAQTMSLEAAYLVLLFVAYATDADVPWETPCILTGTKLMQQLGWSTTQPLGVEQFYQLQNLITALNHWFVVISDLDLATQRYQMIRVPLWTFGDLSIQGVFPKTISAAGNLASLSDLNPYELKLQVSPGSWISLFPQGSTASTLETLHQYGDLAKSLLQISMTQSPFAARLAILLTATSGFHPTGQYQVQQLLTHLMPNPGETLRISPEQQLETIANWDQALCILRQLGWEVEFDASTYAEALRPAWSLPYSSFSTTAQRSDTWLQDWLQAKVTIRPTRLIQQQVMLKGDRYCAEESEFSDADLENNAAKANPLVFIPGDILEKALLAKGISQSKFAEQLNLDRSMVNRWIKGSRVIQPKHQVQIWRLLGNELQPLMGSTPKAYP